MTSEVDNMKESIRRIAALALAGIMAVSEVPGLNVQAEKRNDEGKREDICCHVGHPLFPDRI